MLLGPKWRGSCSFNVPCSAHHPDRPSDGAAWPTDPSVLSTRGHSKPRHAQHAELGLATFHASVSLSDLRRQQSTSNSLLFLLRSFLPLPTGISFTTTTTTTMPGTLLGMGNPLLDISAEVPQEVLDKYELKVRSGREGDREEGWVGGGEDVCALSRSVNIKLTSLNTINSSIHSWTRPFSPRRSTCRSTRSWWTPTRSSTSPAGPPRTPSVSPSGCPRLPG